MKQTAPSPVQALHPRHSLRARVGLAFGTLILLLALLLTVAIERPAERQIEEDIGNNLASRALQVAETLDRELGERLEDLHLLASLPQMRDPAVPPATKRTLLEQVRQRQPAYAWLGVVEAGGTVTAGSGLLPAGTNVGGRDWFRQGQEGPFVGTGAGPPGAQPLVLALPLPEEEGGIMAAYLNWQGIQTLAPGAPGRAGVEVFVFAAGGRRLYGPSEAAGALSAAALPDPASAAYGYNSSLWSGAETYLSGYARLPEPAGYPRQEWWVLVRQQQAAAFAPVRRLQWQILLWGVGLGLLFLLLGWFLAGRIVRPLSRIALAADRIRAGDMAAQIPEQPGGGEIATLAHSLRAMIATLSEQQADLARNQTLLEQRVRERTRTLTALYQVLEVANVAEDLPAALQQALGPVLAATGGEAAFIHLAQEGAPVPAARQGIGAAEIAAWRRQQSADDPVTAVLATAAPLTLSPLEPPETEHGHRPDTYLGVPITSGEHVHGVLSLLGDASRPFVEEARPLLASIADELGIIVENERLQQQAEQLAVLEERNRLARELHDSVTQSLYSLTLFAEAGRRMLAEGDREAAAEFFGDVGDTSRQSLKEMRLLLHKLRPAVLQQEGLVRALRRRLNAVEERSGIANELLLEGELALDPQGEEALYHIATEALNNALRHAQATRVRVLLRQSAEEGVELLVGDDGRGFNPATAVESGGMGMANMRERARHAGGTLAVESAPGQGTTVRVRLPR